MVKTAWVPTKSTNPKALVKAVLGAIQEMP